MLFRLNRTVRLDPAETHDFYTHDQHALLTPWQAEDTKPALPGFYVVREPWNVEQPPQYRDHHAAHWNGLRWSHIIGAHALPWLFSTHKFAGRTFERKYNRDQCYQWRGLNESAKDMQWGDDLLVPVEWLCHAEL